MKLRIIGFENEIQIQDQEVNVIILENPKLFTHIIDIVNDKINKIETNEIFLLNDNNEEIKIDEKAYIIIDLFNIEFNSKRILDKLYNIISSNIEKSQDYEMEKIVLSLRNYLIGEINELPFEFTMKDEIKTIDLLKLYNIKIDKINYNNILERIELIINIISTLNIAEILIIPNLKTYLNDEDLVELYKYSMYNGIKLLIIERNKKSLLKYENQIFIDENFDEF